MVALVTCAISGAVAIGSVIYGTILLVDIMRM
jgi:hypothetical protein